MYGSNLTANNETLRTALESLRATLMSSLGDKSQCIGMIADIEGIVDCIDKKLDQKLDELIFSPNPLALPVGQDISTDPQVQLNFAPVAAPQ